VVVRVDVMEAEAKKSLNTPGGSELMAKVGGKGTSVPFFAFLDRSGDLIVNSNAPERPGHPGGNIGYPYEPQEVDWFLTMLARAAPDMTAGERGTVEKWLRARQKGAPPAAHGVM
jgi:hypothetical protein